MPQILIVTDQTENANEVVYRERIDAVHLASEHSRRQLAERLAWAIGDAARSPVSSGAPQGAVATPPRW